jgi:hypothetical protein
MLRCQVAFFVGKLVETTMPDAVVRPFRGLQGTSVLGLYVP